MSALERRQVCVARSGPARRPALGDAEVSSHGRVRPQRLRAVVILAPHDGAAQRAFDRIVVERDARIVDETRESRPAFEHVPDGLAEIAAWQADLLRGPPPDLIEDRA